MKEIDGQVVEECAQELKMISSLTEKEKNEDKTTKKNETQTLEKEIDIKAANRSKKDIKIISDTNKNDTTEQKVGKQIGRQSFLVATKNQPTASQVFAALSMILIIIIGLFLFKLRPWSSDYNDSIILPTTFANKDNTSVEQVTSSEDLNAQMQKSNSDRLKQDYEKGERTFLQVPAVSKNIYQVGQKSESYFQKMNCVIHFKHNSNELYEGAFEKLDRIIEFMTRNPDTRIEVKGYTDNTGNLDYNLYISELRANLIKTYLTSKGIHNSRIETKGIGPKNPIASNETLEGKKLNRRVEIEFYGKEPM
jgi:outer membrane protein OmpA-like peptidoglycan-associated protein